MNSRRRAELQRKLSIGAVPKPPAGLAERIKSDIPRYLRAESDRDRLSSSIVLNMRIAASVVLLVTSVVVIFHLLTSERDTEVAKSIADAGPEIARRNTDESDAGAAAVAQETAIETAEAMVGTETAASPAPPRTATRERAAARRESAAPTLVAELSADTAAVADAETDGRRQRLARAEEPSSGVVGGVVGGEIGGAPRARADAPQVAEITPTAAPAPPPPPVPASAPAILPDSVPSAATAAKAFAYESLTDAARPAVLGISTDPDAFDRVKAAIERGTPPPSASVDVEALVNYFAGQAERAPRGVRLEVEASPSPVEAEGNRAILRFTVDTPARRSQSGEPEAVATDAQIEIAINDRVVEAIRAVGNGHSVASGSALHYGTSVTRLYELDLRPQLYAAERVATVRLHYTAASGGRRRTIEHVIHARDLAKEWARASRRQRLASLGAIWAESLKGTAGGVEVAQRAEELAIENPQDTRARELAKLASASSKLRGGGGTGSGL